MTHPAITVENLSKVYRLGVKEEAPDTLASALSGVARSPWRNLQRLRRLSRFKGDEDGADTLWALKDVSFEVQEGEVLGVIGRNGAGKSTLLKILSRITEPTSGRAVIRGRVSSLLEVGTGFHPELTGRDNIYMNGTILGMRKREIDRKFDEIVDFSGVERFLDTPIKRYSSGMNVRLAFSVAAHLEPEILIIDEVLAVGDAEFQAKCLGKMRDVARCGRTVLFVSHNMAAIEHLCTRALTLGAGEVAQVGAVEDVVAEYSKSTSLAEVQPMRRARSFAQIIRSVSINSEDPDGGGIVRCGRDAVVSLQFETSAPITNARIGLRVDTLAGAPITHLQSEIATGAPFHLGTVGTVTCRVRQVPLLPGSYSLVVALFSRGVMIDSLNPAIEFQVEAGDFFGTGRLPASSLGTFLLASEWAVSDGN